MHYKGTIKKSLAKVHLEYSVLLSLRLHFKQQIKWYSKRDGAAVINLLFEKNG